MPTVSVIVPVYRTEPYLRRCLDGLLAQTLEDMEFLLVDDGSPDGCPAICDEYAARDRRFRVFHKPNGGVMSALLVGMKAAAADYVGFVDSDDWVDPPYFEVLYRAAIDKRADVVTTEVLEHVLPAAGDETGVPLTEHHVPVGPDFYPAPDGGRQELALYFRHVTMNDRPTPSVKWKWDKLYRRALLLDNLPYCNTAIWCGEDLAMNIAILADCRQVAILRGGPTYHYRQVAGSAARTFYSDDYSQRHMENDIALYETILRAARDKGLDLESVYPFLGRHIYQMFFQLAQSPKAGLRQKCAGVRRLLTAAPAPALPKYAAARGGRAIRLLCALLRPGLAPLCVLLVGIKSALFGRDG